ncbi:MAG: hypothetical protein LBB24_02115 [Rickettsiales bacterium]|jgi:hypothetical protein|nr:hypothetical protein [Rickettsiales bacterium]
MAPHLLAAEGRGICSNTGEKIGAGDTLEEEEIKAGETIKDEGTGRAAVIAGQAASEAFIVTYQSHSNYLHLTTHPPQKVKKRT